MLRALQGLITRPGRCKLKREIQTPKAVASANSLSWGETVAGGYRHFCLRSAEQHTLRACGACFSTGLGHLNGSIDELSAPEAARAHAKGPQYVGTAQM